MQWNCNGCSFVNPSFHMGMPIDHCQMCSTAKTADYAMHAPWHLAHPALMHHPPMARPIRRNPPIKRKILGKLPPAKRSKPSTYEEYLEHDIRAILQPNVIEYPEFYQDYFRYIGEYGLARILWYQPTHKREARGCIRMVQDMIQDNLFGKEAENESLIFGHIEEESSEEEEDSSEEEEESSEEEKYSSEEDEDGEEYLEEDNIEKLVKEFLETDSEEEFESDGANENLCAKFEILDSESETEKEEDNDEKENKEKEKRNYDCEDENEETENEKTQAEEQRAILNPEKIRLQKQEKFMEFVIFIQRDREVLEEISDTVKNNIIKRVLSHTFFFQCLPEVFLFGEFLQFLDL